MPGVLSSSLKYSPAKLYGHGRSVGSGGPAGRVTTSRVPRDLSGGGGPAALLPRRTGDTARRGGAGAGLVGDGTRPAGGVGEAERRGATGPPPVFPLLAAAAAGLVAVVASFALPAGQGAAARGLFVTAVVALPCTATRGGLGFAPAFPAGAGAGAVTGAGAGAAGVGAACAGAAASSWLPVRFGAGLAPPEEDPVVARAAPLDLAAASPPPAVAGFPAAAAAPPAVARALVAAAAISLSRSRALSAFALAIIARLGAAAAAAAATLREGASPAATGGAAAAVLPLPLVGSDVGGTGVSVPVTAAPAAAGDDGDEASGGDCAGGAADACSTWTRGELLKPDVSTPSSARRITASSLPSGDAKVMSRTKSAKARKRQGGGGAQVEVSKGA